MATRRAYPRARRAAGARRIGKVGSLGVHGVRRQAMLAARVASRVRAEESVLRRECSTIEITGGLPTGSEDGVELY